MNPTKLSTRARGWLQAAVVGTLTLASGAASAAPEAHLLRVDPRAGMGAGSPTLSTLLEIGQYRSVSDVTSSCGNLTGNALADCYADEVEKPNALWTPLQFPEQNANLLVRVEGADTPSTYVSKTLWKDAQKEAGVGTAWLLALDCAKSMGNRYADGREVVTQFVKQVGKNDLVRLVLFDDRDNAYTADSKWLTYAKRNEIINLLNQHPGNAPSGGSSRPLFNTVKNIITNGFNDLGNVGDTNSLPMHQAFVLLSNGAGREDALSNAAGALQINQYATEGRLKQDDPSSMKMPLPIISVHLPNGTAGLTNKYMANNDVQFMQSLANPQIGGYYSIVREGQGNARGERIAKAVKTRFNSMWLVKWKLSCLNPSVEQSFNLTFTNTKQAIAPDGSFKNVPIGVDPSQWPLDINVAATQAAASADPIHPGGKFKVFGTFCWGGDKQRAEAYFLPKGMQFDPNMKNGGLAAAQRMMQQLIAQNMKGAANQANQTYVEFEVPDDDKLLDGSGDNQIARVVVFDNRASRVSGIDAETVLTLKAASKPLNLLLVGGIAAAALVVILLVAVLLRGGGGGKRGGRGGGGGGGGGGGTPQPVYPGAGGGYGGQPGGYGGQPGGYGGQPGGYGGQPGGYGGQPGGGGYGYSAAPAEPAMAVAHIDLSAPEAHVRESLGRDGRREPAHDLSAPEAHVPVAHAPAPAKRQPTENVPLSIAMQAVQAVREEGALQAPSFPAHLCAGRAGLGAAGQPVRGAARHAAVRGQ